MEIVVADGNTAILCLGVGFYCRETHVDNHNSVFILLQQWP